MRFASWLLLPFRLVEIVQRVRRPRPPSGQAGTPGPVAPLAPAAMRPEPELGLAIEVCETRQGCVVRLRGEAGVVEADTLESALLPLIRLRLPRVTFDLSELVFISSLGMGVLAAFRRAAVRAGARVYLVPRMRPEVHVALEWAGLLNLFERPVTKRNAVLH
jgi:anti-anti-sigma factor